MNYLDQIKGFWITQEVNQLGTSEIAMYFYLLEIWNKTVWIGTFKRNNYKVMGDLSIKSPKTLQSVRDKLQNAGLMIVKQRNGDANAEYTMADLGKIYRGSGKGLVEGSGIGSVQGKGKGSGIVNINETKPDETNTENTVVPASPAPSIETKSEPVITEPPKNPAAEKPKKKVAPKKKNEPRPFWQPCIIKWETFYASQKPEPYEMSTWDYKDLGHVYDLLQRRAERKKSEWTEDYMLQSFDFFLNMAYKVPWLKNNFSLSNVLKQFNQILHGAADTIVATGTESGSGNGGPGRKIIFDKA